MTATRYTGLPNSSSSESARSAAARAAREQISGFVSGFVVRAMEGTDGRGDDAVQRVQQRERRRCVAVQRDRIVQDPHRLPRVAHPFEAHGERERCVEGGGCVGEHSGVGGELLGGVHRGGEVADLAGSECRRAEELHPGRVHARAADLGVQASPDRSCLAQRLVETALLQQVDAHPHLRLDGESAITDPYREIAQRARRSLRRGRIVGRGWSATATSSSSCRGRVRGWCGVRGHDRLDLSIGRSRSEHESSDERHPNGRRNQRGRQRRNRAARRRPVVVVARPSTTTSALGRPSAPGITQVKWSPALPDEIGTGVPGQRDSEAE